MTQSTQCGFRRESGEVEDQTYARGDDAAPLDQSASGVRERERPTFDWRPDDRVELVAWQPDDLVWLAPGA